MIFIHVRMWTLPESNILTNQNQEKKIQFLSGRCNKKIVSAL